MEEQARTVRCASNIDAIESAHVPALELLESARTRTSLIDMLISSRASTQSSLRAYSISFVGRRISKRTIDVSMLQFYFRQLFYLGSNHRRPL